MLAVERIKETLLWNFRVEAGSRGCYDVLRVYTTSILWTAKPRQCSVSMNLALDGTLITAAIVNGRSAYL